MANTITIRTRDKVVYDKLNSLNFMNECYIPITCPKGINRIIRSINRKQILIKPYFGNGEVYIRRMNPIKDVRFYLIK